MWNDEMVRDEMAAYLDVDGDGLEVDYAGVDDDGLNGWEVEDPDGRAFMVSDNEDAFAGFAESVTRTPGGLFYIREA